MNPSRPLDALPSHCWAVQCFAHGACVLYVDQYADASLAALHGIPGDPQPTHAQRWTPEMTHATRRIVLLDRFLRYVHPELAQDPRELPVYAVAEVTSAAPSPWMDARRN
jgi:hypothetical protein